MKRNWMRTCLLYGTIIQENRIEGAILATVLAAVSLFSTVCTIGLSSFSKFKARKKQEKEDLKKEVINLQESLDKKIKDWIKAQKNQVDWKEKRTKLSEELKDKNLSIQKIDEALQPIRTRINSLESEIISKTDLIDEQPHLQSIILIKQMSIRREEDQYTKLEKQKTSLEVDRTNIENEIKNLNTQITAEEKIREKDRKYDILTSLTAMCLNELDMDMKEHKNLDEWSKQLNKVANELIEKSTKSQNKYLKAIMEDITQHWSETTKKKGFFHFFTRTYSYKKMRSLIANGANLNTEEISYIKMNLKKYLKDANNQETKEAFYLVMQHQDFAVDSLKVMFVLKNVDLAYEKYRLTAGKIKKLLTLLWYSSANDLSLKENSDEETDDQLEVEDYNNFGIIQEGGKIGNKKELLLHLQEFLNIYITISKSLYSYELKDNHTKLFELLKKGEDMTHDEILSVMLTHLTTKERVKDDKTQQIDNAQQGIQDVAQLLTEVGDLGVIR